MKLKVVDAEMRLARLQTRMPFRYGIATMTRVPLAFVRVRLEIDGRPADGISSDCLPPKWFTKIPDKALDVEVEEMLTVIRQAMQAAQGLQSDSAFDLWLELYGKQSAWGSAQGLPPLLTHFGTSLVERAVLEAFCRGTNRTFAQALKENALGIRLEAVHPPLRGLTTAALLPAQPLGRITIRHTVGLADPLTDQEIPAGEKLTDGLPQSLVDCVQRYGLRHFKIKVNGKLESDLDRLRTLARILKEKAPRDFAFSLDGNEQFKSMEAFQSFWKEMLAQADLRDFFQHLLFVEQPLHRDAALGAPAGHILRQWKDGPAVIIDESDATIEDLPLALRLGYAGTSHKNCKGVFKGIAHRCLLQHLGQSEPARRLLMSGEDLCTIGPVALPQDLAVMAALGIQSVERNGHHYHAGLSQLPAGVGRAVMAHHADLYQATAQGWPAVHIERGEIIITSVNGAPFGVGFALDLQPFEKVAA